MLVYQYLGMTHWSMLHKDRAEKFMISAEMPHVDKALSAYTKSVNVFLSCPGYERQALESEIISVVQRIKLIVLHDCRFGTTS